MSRAILDGFADLTTRGKLITINFDMTMQEVSTMLFGKFCIDFGSTQVYTTKHCAEPFRKVDL